MKKVCSKCKIEKEINFFSFKNRKENKMEYKCKDCVSQYRKDRIKHHDEIMIVLDEKSRICITCKKQKNIDLFPNEKGLKNGKRNQCKDCRNENKRKIWHKNKHKYKEKHALTTKLWAQKNKERRRETNAKLKKQKKHKDKRNKYIKDRCKSDPVFKINQRIRALIKSSFKRKNHRKKCKTIQILGCSFEEFKVYIENQFEPWMNWGNYGRYTCSGKRTWQLDHKIPTSTAMSEKQIIELNHYTNFRPLDSYENIKKGISIIF